jgi:hypothetical protein
MFLLEEMWHGALVAQLDGWKVRPLLAAAAGGGGGGGGGIGGWLVTQTAG